LVKSKAALLGGGANLRALKRYGVLLNQRFRSHGANPKFARLERLAYFMLDPDSALGMLL
jgi:hypothetical protein